jgi:hypothetical protein
MPGNDYVRPTEKKLPDNAAPAFVPLEFKPWDLDAVSRHRHIECKNYDACLTHAIVKGWANFTCRRCPMFVENSDTNTVPFLVALKSMFNMEE